MQKRQEEPDQQTGQASRSCGCLQQRDFDTVIGLLKTAKGFLEVGQDCEECDAPKMLRPASALVTAALGQLEGNWQTLHDAAARVVARHGSAKGAQ